MRGEGVIGLGSGYLDSNWGFRKEAVSALRISDAGLQGAVLGIKERDPGERQGTLGAGVIDGTPGFAALL